jgi:hypothetical protein
VLAASTLSSSSPPLTPNSSSVPFSDGDEPYPSGDAEYHMYGFDDGRSDDDLRDDHERAPPSEFAQCCGDRRGLPILIPRSLPLPAAVRENSWNLIYFNHFLHHSAPVLVPHDDAELNPFRTVLPAMACRNPILMQLLLAYSAAHRARRLKYAEPTIRIATYIYDVISTLQNIVREARKPEPNIATADIATAIMLASLEIISPASLGGVVDKTEQGQEQSIITWQTHLSLAREIISHLRHRNRLAGDWADTDHQACAFLCTLCGAFLPPPGYLPKTSPFPPLNPTYTGQVYSPDWQGAGLFI